MTAKFKLNPDPTFKAKVGIPVPGVAEPVEVEFTFKYRTRSDVTAWHEAIKDKQDHEIIIDCVTAWELTDDYTAENVKRLCDNYPSAGAEIAVAYLRELAGIRSKN